MSNDFRPAPPTLHPDYPIGLPVTFRLTDTHMDNIDGWIIGIAALGIAYTYIIKLANPLPYKGYEGWEAIAAWGTLLTPRIEGKTDDQS